MRRSARSLRVGTARSAAIAAGCGVSVELRPRLHRRCRAASHRPGTGPFELLRARPRPCSWTALRRVRAPDRRAGGPLHESDATVWTSHRHRPRRPACADVADPGGPPVTRPRPAAPDHQDRRNHRASPPGAGDARQGAGPRSPPDAQTTRRPTAPHNAPSAAHRSAERPVEHGTTEVQDRITPSSPRPSHLAEAHADRDASQERRPPARDRHLARDASCPAPATDGKRSRHAADAQGRRRKGRRRVHDDPVKRSGCTSTRDAIQPSNSTRGGGWLFVVRITGLRFRMSRGVAVFRVVGKCCGGWQPNVVLGRCADVPAPGPSM